jgi:hypothetical protein
MASLGKKILSAFLEVADEKKEGSTKDQNRHDAANAGVRTDAGTDAGQAQDSRGNAVGPDAGRQEPRSASRADDRFAGHFDQLLSEANIPGPDYYEFSRMIGVMQGIPDEGARYGAAFAGLQVQGLDKQQLLTTAGEYLRILATDADQFQKTVDAALQEKVRGKETEAEEKAGRIQALSQEILQLQQQISALQAEVRANKDKLTSGSSAYTAESQRRQQQIKNDIDKINQYIH